MGKVKIDFQKLKKPLGIFILALASALAGVAGGKYAAPIKAAADVAVVVVESVPVAETKDTDPQ